MGSDLRGNSLNSIVKLSTSKRYSYINRTELTRIINCKCTCIPQQAEKIPNNS